MTGSHGTCLMSHLSLFLVSMVERTVINVEQLDDTGELHASPWQSASYAPEPELTPAYLEEQLLGPGSMTSKFFEAIMRPGVFSPLTLRTAIDQYSDACLSLPGPPPPQLSRRFHFRLLSQLVVGLCGSHRPQCLRPPLVRRKRQ